MRTALPPAARRMLRSAVTTAVTRLRPVAPPAMWEVLMTARSMAGDGPVVAVPGHRRALVLSPHPDDETLGCGGTVALLAAAGGQVEVLVASSGEASVITPGTSVGTARAREIEVTAACAALGARPPHFAHRPDGRVGDDPGALAGAIEALVSKVRPEAILVPWPLDGHADHQAVSTALATLDLDERIEVWCYEVWAALPANRIVDVSPVWARKLEAMECHRGRDVFDLDAHLGLQRWRSIFGLDGFGHAEAFLVLRPSQLRALVAGRVDVERRRVGPGVPR